MIQFRAKSKGTEYSRSNFEKKIFFIFFQLVLRGIKNIHTFASVI